MHFVECSTAEQQLKHCHASSVTHRYFKTGIVNMKLTTIALASASLIAFATPAAAAGDGWYLGLGAGWTKLNQVPYAASVPGHINFTSTARVDGSAGYKWASGFRLELEDGYANYKVRSATTSRGVPSS